MKKSTLALLLIVITTSLTASVSVLERSADHLTLEFRLDNYRLVRQGEYVRIDAGGMIYNGEIGSPLLPYEEIKIGVPPGGEIRVALLSASRQEETLAARLLPVPRVSAGAEGSQYDYEFQAELYEPGEAQLLRPLEEQTFRGYGFVPLLVSPFLYDGELSLQVTTQAVFRVDILGDLDYRSAAAEDGLTTLLLDQLLNPEQARTWFAAQRFDVNYADFGKADLWLRLETDREGLYKITPAQLSGFPLDDIDPRSFRLFSNGGTLLPFTIMNAGNPFREIPIQVVGESDGSFDPTDYIVFYGTTRDGLSKNQSLQTNSTYYSPYSGNAVYWLTFAGEFDGLPLRMEQLPTQPSWTAQTPTFRDMKRLETESQRREITGFDWYMTRLFGYSTADYQFELDLPDLDVSATPALSFRIIGEDGGGGIWHSISVYVNDLPVQADTLGGVIFRWYGESAYTFYKPVSGLVEGTNTIRIKVLRSGTDNLFLDWITVDHTRIIRKSVSQMAVRNLTLNYGIPVRYDLASTTDAGVYQVNSFFEAARVPLQSAGSSQYFVASGTSDTQYFLCSDADLYSPLNLSFLQPRDLTADLAPVDNIIITADEFHAQALALAEAYAQSPVNRNSLVVKQSEVFNQFNGGHPDPVALRQFLRYAWQNFPTPAPTSVTLLGLGSIDWRNNSGQAASKNKLIVYQRSGTTSDDYFSYLTQNNYPELMIGRYPVSSATEMNNMLANFQTYHGDPQGGWWRNSMVILADDLFNGSQATYDNYHSQQVEEAADLINPSILVDKIFAWEYEYDEYQNKPGARDDMVAAINEGRLVWMYTGHGSYDKLGAEDYFNGASDLGRFQNQDKLPVFLAASCSVSHFDYWGFESLGQMTVLLNNRGAIASYSATRLSNPYQNAPMMNFLLDALANKRNPLGYSVLRAKVLNTANPTNDEFYVLLGDPLLMALPPARDSLMTLAGADGSPLRARQLANVSGAFSPSSYTGKGEFRVYNTENAFDLDWETHVSHRGASLFRGEMTVEAGQYEAGFIVPDDVTTGESGLIVSYLWDPQERKDYVNYYSSLPLSDEAVTAENPDAPSIQLFLGSLDFRPGDTVSANPTLYARISDSNGINITGSSGHSILLVLDNSLQPLAVTGSFSYDLDSHTQGWLTYPLSGLAEGHHTVQLIAFDNFNLPAVASIDFQVKDSGDLLIDRFLIYPNPMQKQTSFTFMLSLDCEIKLSIFTVTGKKVHTMQATGSKGFNALNWDGRDAQGDRLANNTYFVKISASLNGKSASRTERLVIYN